MGSSGRKDTATWFGVAGQWASALATAFIAVKVDQWQRCRATEEQREREVEQARLVVITMNYSSDGSSAMSVEITNRSEQEVRWLKIETISNTQPEVRWGERTHLVDENGEQVCLQPDGVLLPRRSTRVPHQHFDADGRVINLADAFFERDDPIKIWVQVDDVTISFYMFGVRWWRIGNRDPVRVDPPR